MQIQNIPDRFPHFTLIPISSIFTFSAESFAEWHGGRGRRVALALFSWLSSFSDSEQAAISLSIALIMSAVRGISHRKEQDGNFILS